MVQMEMLDRLASRIGLYPAVLLMKVRAWTRTNERNGQQKKDGRYWMYNSIAAWHALIPYMSEKQIRTAMKYLRDNGYLLAEKAKKCQWNQTMHYALSDFAAEVFRQIEGDSKPISQDEANEFVSHGKSMCPNSGLDLPSPANDANILPNPLPCKKISHPLSHPDAPAVPGELPPETLKEQLDFWHITETEMQDFLRRTGRPSIWAYQWLGIMMEDLRSGHVAEYRSPIGALMIRHTGNWPLPRPANRSGLPENKAMQARLAAARRKMLDAYNSAQPDPGSLFLKIHNKLHSAAVAGGTNSDENKGATLLCLV